MIEEKQLGITLPAKTLKALDEVDILPKDHKLFVHEFGYPIYQSMVEAGLRNVPVMRQLVNSIWTGARASKGKRNRVRSSGQSGNLQTLDWLLVQSGSDITAAQLVRFLWLRGLVILPIHPIPQMVNASVGTVRGGGRTVSDQQKHTLRLRAAQEAGARQLWPYLFSDKADVSDENRDT